MEKILRISDKQAGIYEGYLMEVVEAEGLEVEKDFYMERVYTWSGYKFFLSDRLVGCLETFEHDCDAQDGGCSFCYFLQELGIIPEYDETDSEDVEEETTIVAQRFHSKEGK